MAKWFVHEDGRNSGPFTSTEMRQLVAEGRIGLKTPIRREGQIDWVTARSVSNLFKTGAIKRKKKEGDSTAEAPAVEPAATAEEEPQGDVLAALEELADGEAAVEELDAADEEARQAEVMAALDALDEGSEEDWDAFFEEQGKRLREGTVDVPPDTEQLAAAKAAEGAWGDVDIDAALEAGENLLEPIDEPPPAPPAEPAAPASPPAVPEAAAEPAGDAGDLLDEFDPLAGGADPFAPAAKPALAAATAPLADDMVFEDDPGDPGGTMKDLSIGRRPQDKTTIIVIVVLAVLALGACATLLIMAFVR